MMHLIKNNSLVKRAAQFLRRNTKSKASEFVDSNSYWINRYKNGGNSGYGSYDKLAKFKAEVLNHFVNDKKIITVIEYGCGDGNQLKLAKYPKYTGFDISPDALSLCKKVFKDDRNKSFKLMGQYLNETAELTLSLDVVYHLIEDEVFISYMNRLFDSSDKYVILYSCNFDIDARFNFAAHVKPRKFTEWVSVNKKEWFLLEHISNKYPYGIDSQNGSFADFYIYQKTSLEDLLKIS